MLLKLGQVLVVEPAGLGDEPVVLAGLPYLEVLARPCQHCVRLETRFRTQVLGNENSALVVELDLSGACQTIAPDALGAYLVLRQLVQGAVPIGSPFGQGVDFDCSVTTSLKNELPL